MNTHEKQNTLKWVLGVIFFPVGGFFLIPPINDFINNYVAKFNLADFVPKFKVAEYIDKVNHSVFLKTSDWGRFLLAFVLIFSLFLSSPEFKSISVTPAPETATSPTNLPKKNTFELISQFTENTEPKVLVQIYSFKNFDEKKMLDFAKSKASNNNDSIAQIYFYPESETYDGNNFMSRADGRSLKERLNLGSAYSHKDAYDIINENDFWTLWYTRNEKVDGVTEGTANYEVRNLIGDSSFSAETKQNCYFKENFKSTLAWEQLSAKSCGN